MEQITQYSPEIEDALKAARKFFSNREAQFIYEAQWRAELDRRWHERYRNETRDAERDATRDVERDARRDAQRDREHDATMLNEMSNEKRAYISRRLTRFWNVSPSEANRILKDKTNYRELNAISEKMDDCENYEDFLKLLQKISEQTTV